MPKLLARPFGWSIADQVLSSVSNFALGALVLRVSDPNEFGTFAIVFAIYTFALTVGRAAAGTPLLLTGVTGPRHVAGANTLAFGISLGFALPIVIAAAFFSTPTSTYLILLAAGLPLLLVQDACRYAAFTQGSPRSAFRLDLAWLVGQFGAFVALYALGMRSGHAVFLSWILGCACALLTTASGRAGLRARSPRAYLLDNRALVRSLVPEAAICSGLAFVNTWALALILTTEDLGRVRAALMMLGPILMVQMGIGPTLTVHLRNRREDGLGTLLRLTRGTSRKIWIGGAIYCALIWSMPSQSVDALLGPTAVSARDLLLVGAFACSASICLNNLLIVTWLVCTPARAGTMRYVATLGSSASMALGAYLGNASSSLLAYGAWHAIFALLCGRVILSRVASPDRGSPGSAFPRQREKSRSDGASSPERTGGTQFRPVITRSARNQE